MKKIFALVLACCLILLNACSNATSSNPSSVTESSTAAMESSIVPMEEEPSEESKSATEEKSISGNIVDATMNMITIQTDGGEQIEFSKTDVTVNSIDGLLIGDYVTIYYTETLEDNQVTKIDETIK